MVNILRRNLFDRKNRQIIGNFTGIPFKTDSDDYEEKIQQNKDDISVKDLIRMCNVLCIDNLDCFSEIAPKIISLFT